MVREQANPAAAEWTALAACAAAGVTGSTDAVMPNITGRRAAAAVAIRSAFTAGFRLERKRRQRSSST
jgi:hypothetical protein